MNSKHQLPGNAPVPPGGHSALRNGSEQGEFCSKSQEPEFLLKTRGARHVNHGKPGKRHGRY